MTTPLPFPTPWSTPLPPVGSVEGRRGPRKGAPALISAVAAVVAIAAARSRATGDLAALRHAIAVALDEAERGGA
ncbi:hypothetical protein [Roseomonas sp. AR75]|uniref:hypothetical protein n=1 Tax=Roseomonas sp. AR75 TaxID=2562311 RepID=UPI0010BFA3EE|nr:hypothetical protein [Roseomonas sp. AR75]